MEDGFCLLYRRLLMDTDPPFFFRGKRQKVIENGEIRLLHYCWAAIVISQMMHANIG
jgi:hypothetical protein